MHRAAIANEERRARNLNVIIEWINQKGHYTYQIESINQTVSQSINQSINQGEREANNSMIDSRFINSFVLLCHTVRTSAVLRARM